MIFILFIFFTLLLDFILFDFSIWNIIFDNMFDNYLPENHIFSPLSSNNYLNNLL